MMPKLLKLAKFLYGDGMSQMNIRGCGVYPKLNAQWSPKLKLFLQLFFADDFRCS